MKEVFFQFQKVNFAIFPFLIVSDKILAGAWNTVRETDDSVKYLLVCGRGLASSPGLGPLQTRDKWNEAGRDYVEQPVINISIIQLCSLMETRSGLWLQHLSLQFRFLFTSFNYLWEFPFCLLDCSEGDIHIFANNDHGLNIFRRGRSYK